MSPPARATFSIVAVDPDTGQIGSAGASCVSGAYSISDVLPGLGAIHTQAADIDSNKSLARQRMLAGDSPQEIMDYMATHDAEGQPAIRQYGAVDFRDGAVRSAAFTGTSTITYAGHLAGATYAIQGNILLGPEILTNMEKAFVEASGALADKLMAALQGANVPSADRRCGVLPSISAFVRVARPDDPNPSGFLDLNVDLGDFSQNPIDLLQERFEEWKLQPVVAFEAKPTAGTDPLVMVLDASDSRAVAGATITAYSWYFGDGEVAAGVATSHTYLLPGTYRLLLEVMDSNGRVGKGERTVEVSFREENPAPWVCTDIGTPSAIGSGRFEDGRLTAVGGGPGFRNTSDHGHFSFQEVEGDFAITANVYALNGYSGGSSAGVTLRATTDGGAPFAAVFIEQLASRISVQWASRQTQGARAILESGSSISPPNAWIRITRSGDLIAGETSPDGEAWSRIGEVSMAVPNMVLAGVAISTPSRFANARGAARLCAITIEQSDPGENAFHRADPNLSATTDLSDAVTIFGHLFLGEPSALACLESADTNNDGAIDISDGIALLNWLFTGGPEPAAPGPSSRPCGVDPDEVGSQGDLGCGEYPACL